MSPMDHRSTNNNNTSASYSWTLSSYHKRLLQEYDIPFDRPYVTGLTTEQVSEQRRSLRRKRNEGGSRNVGHDDDDDYDDDDTMLNTILPPIQCPAWVCCLLPCIYHIPSMKIYKNIMPEDAEVLRDDRWIRYDATSLIGGDIIRLYRHDRIPADCMILHHDGDVYVDMRYITGHAHVQKMLQQHIRDDDDVNQLISSHILYCGGFMIDGTVIAMVMAVGSQTKMSQLIQSKQFPAKMMMTTTMSSASDYDIEATNDRDDNDIYASAAVGDGNVVHHDHIALLHRTRSVTPPSSTS